MTLLFFDGFEGGTVIKPEWSTTPAIGTTTPRTGTYTMIGLGATLTIPASDKVTVGFAQQMNTASLTHYVKFLGDNGATTHLTVILSNSSAVQLRLGTQTGTILATGTDIFPTSEWRHVQVQATIADSGGRCIVKVDGATWIDYTGDTKNGGTATTIDRVFVGGSASNSNSRFDDLWVCDGVDATATQGRPNNDFLGDLKVSVILPEAAGDSTQWTPSTGSNNWAVVDEPSANTSDYVSASTTGLRDLYALQNLPANSVAVYGVRMGLYVSKSDAGAASISSVIKDSLGTIATGAVYTLSTSWTGYNDVFRWVKPSGGLWSVSDVNGLQAGMDSA
jgi:hypothetical protein